VFVPGYRNFGVCGVIGGDCRNFDGATCARCREDGIMAYIVEQYKLAYFPAPKNACTSLKTLMYFLQTGEKFVKHVGTDGKLIFIHDMIKSPKFVLHDPASTEDCFRFAVVRDPIERFCSFYANRVVDFKELSEKVVHGPLARELGLKADPDINEFVDKLAAYRYFNEGISHHTDPQTYYLGPDPSYFHKLYDIKQLGQLLEDLRSKTGQDVELPRFQVSASHAPASDLTRHSLRALRQFYSGDYAFLRGMSL
jgi:hypothetical protein